MSTLQVLPAGLVTVQVTVKRILEPVSYWYRLTTLLASFKVGCRTDNTNTFTVHKAIGTRFVLGTHRTGTISYRHRLTTLLKNVRVCCRTFS